MSVWNMDEMARQRNKSLNVNIELFLGDQSEEDEMGGACGTHGGGEECIQHFGWEA
jgi:hypothetical protein